MFSFIYKAFLGKAEIDRKCIKGQMVGSVIQGTIITLISNSWGQNICKIIPASWFYGTAVGLYGFVNVLASRVLSLEFYKSLSFMPQLGEGSVRGSITTITSGDKGLTGEALKALIDP